MKSGIQVELGSSFIFNMVLREVKEKNVIWVLQSFYIFDSSKIKAKCVKDI